MEASVRSRSEHGVRRPRRSTFDRVYFVGVLVKGVDGLAELVLGAVLVVAPSLLHATLAAGAGEAREVASPARLWIAQYLARADLDLARAGSLVLILFLLVHGVVKIATAYCLVRRIVRAYPWAIAVLIALLGYQVFLVGSSPSVTGLAFAVLDVLIIGLVVREYQVLRAPQKPHADGPDAGIRPV